MKKWLWLFIALPVLAQGPSNPPGVISVPTAPTSCATVPLKVVNGTNDLYGNNGSGGCAEIGGSTTAPGGSSGQIQYNNAGAFGGASGGITNGVHWAFGSGSTLNSVPTSAPDGIFTFSPNVTVAQEETSTDPNFQNGQYTGLTLNPSAVGTNSAVAAYHNLIAQGGNYEGGQAIIGGWNAVTSQITSSEDSAPGYLVGSVSGVYDTGAGELEKIWSEAIDVINQSTGTVDTAAGVELRLNQTSTGTIQNLFGVDVNYGAGTGSTVGNLVGLYVETPQNGGDDIGITTGVEIDPQNPTGVGQSFGVYQAGTSDENDFFGPTIFHNSATTFARIGSASICSSTASPAACGSAIAGLVQVAAAATSLVIDSTAITANTGCWFTYDTEGITAPTNIASLITPYISARTAGTSITITLPVAPVAHPVNIQFGCMN